LTTGVEPASAQGLWAGAAAASRLSAVT